MKIALVSNIFNHHQKYLSDALYSLTDGQFCFVATKAMTNQLKNLGYQQFSEIPYLINAYESEEKEAFAMEQILSADIVIAGSAPSRFIKQYKKSSKPLLMYTERPFKKQDSLPVHILRFLKWKLSRLETKNTYILCAGAFAYYDYSKYNMFKNKAYKWGYFAQTQEYDISSLIGHKKKTAILWMGRFLDWKHPDDVLRLAKMLKDAGCSFSIDIGGTGEMESDLKAMAQEMNLSDCVTFLGPIPSDKVRSRMEEAGIYLFTSDRQEGWGVVLNEAMNSGCAVVASHLIGSAPLLIENGKNGLLYHSGDVEDLFNKVKLLLEKYDEQERLGKAAYETIVNEWNPAIAAERVFELSKRLVSGEKHPDLNTSGPCGKAELLSEDWF